MSQSETDSSLPSDDNRTKAHVEIDSRTCKACGLCIAFCPRKVLQPGESVNALGYRATRYRGDGCIGCGICREVCPEPGVIAVHKADRARGLSSSERNRL